MPPTPPNRAIERKTRVEQLKLTDAELKRLSRTELLEMLIAEMKRTEALEGLLDDYEEQLSERRLDVEEAGDLATACLKVNGVFDASREACRQYEENIRMLSAKTEDICRRKLIETVENCREKILAANAECAKKREETEQACEKMLQKAKDEREELIRRGKNESEAYWNAVYARMEEYRRTYGELSFLFERGTQKRGE